MRISTLAISLSIFALVASTPIRTSRDLGKRLVTRHLVDSRQFGHGSTVDSAHILATASVYLEDSDGIALLTSQNFTTIIVETHLGASTLIAAWGAQPIYSLGQGSGYILGIPERVYAPFELPEVDQAQLPVQVCTYVFLDADIPATNVTIGVRNKFSLEEFVSQIGLSDSISELCVRVGHASTTTTSGGTLPSTGAGEEGDGSNTGSPSAPTAPTTGHSSAPPSPSAPPTESSHSVVGPSVTASDAAPSMSSTSTSHEHEETSSLPILVPTSVPTSSTVSTSAAGSTSTSASLPSSANIGPTASVSASATGTGTISATSATSSASSSDASLSSSTTSASSSSAPSSRPSISLTGPDPAYETTVSFANKKYANKGLVGFGAIPGDAVDSYGDTISLGSAIVLESFTREADGTYSGVMVAQPDRGHNTDVTTDYIARRHRLSFSLNPYYSNTSLGYQDAKSTFDLKYQNTLRYFEADGTPTTGLDARGVRNGTVPQPIPSAGYDHISTDAEGLVILADGSAWISDEYGPYIWKYSAEGVLLDTIVPPKAVMPYTNGSLDFSSVKTEAGPDTGRVKNQGFEGLTVSPDSKTLFALLQSGTVQDLDKNKEGRYTRLFVYDISGTPVLTHSYVLKLPVTNGKGKTLAQSDVLYLSEDTFMLLSRDGKGNGDDDSESKHKDFMLFNLNGATNLINTDYTDSVKPVAPGGVLDESITAIELTQFIDIIDETQLARFGLHNDGDFDVSLINGKWESAAITSVQDPAYPNDYFLFSFSDNDFITTDGHLNGEAYVDAYGSTLDNQALVWRITLP